MPEQKLSDVGGLIRTMRMYLGLTQEGLAQRAAVSKSTIEAVERGSGRPRVSTVEAVLAALCADRKLFSNALLGKAVIAVDIKPLSDQTTLFKILEPGPQIDHLMPWISDPSLAAIARDAIRYFVQIAEIFDETPDEDRAIYVQEVLEAFAGLRKLGWNARIGLYKRRSTATGPWKKICILRLLPARQDSAVLFCCCPIMHDLSGADVIHPARTTS